MSTKEVLEQQIREQGDLVRKLKAAKESTDRVLVKTNYYNM